MHIDTVTIISDESHVSYFIIYQTRLARGSFLKRFSLYAAGSNIQVVQEASLLTEAIKRDLLVTADHGEYCILLGMRISNHFINLIVRMVMVYIGFLVILQATMTMMTFHSGLIPGQGTILLKLIMPNLQILLLQMYIQ